MTSAYVLILAILVLGGLLATMGDRLGTKVGKARLSLFGLRPKQTATVVTIITGFTIAASTLGILFATSKSLRIGIFRLDDKLKQLREARKELTQVTIEKNKVEAELAKAREQQIIAQQQLDAIDESLQSVLDKQAETQAELSQTQSQLNQVQTDFQQAKTELSQIESKFERAQTQLTQVTEQAQTLREEIEQLQAERQQLMEKGEQVRMTIAQRDRELSAKKQQLDLQKQELDRQKLLLEEQKRQLAQQAIEIAAQEQEIQRQQQEMAAQNQEIAAQQQELIDQEKEIAAQERDITRQQRAIVQQEEEMAQQQLAIDRQEREIAQQQQRIIQQEQEIVLQEEEIAQRELEIVDQEQAIAAQNQEIAQQTKLLKELGNQQAFLQREVQNLERDFQLLREGTVAVRRNQVLASGVIRVLKPASAPQAAKELLEQANLAAINLVLPGTTQNKEQVISITDAEVKQLIEQIDDGRDYVVRILSAANYLLGERQVDVFADAVPNQAIFERGEVVATTSVTPSKMSAEQIRERIDLLLAAANFRARRSGILSDSIQIGDGRLVNLIEFINRLEEYDEPTTLQAIAAERTYTAGPLKIELAVIQKGQMIFPDE